MLPFAVFVIIAYLIGSVLFSILLARLFNAKDPRLAGSKNAGATNMLRVNSLYLAVPTLILDLLKGLIPVMAANYFGFDELHSLLIGLAAIIGHILPVFYKFSGGKGVATAIGVMLGVNYIAAVLLLLVWVLVFLITKISSLSALIGFVAATMFSFYNADIYVSTVQMIITIIIFITHKNNIIGFLNGDEKASVIFKKKIG